MTPTPPTAAERETLAKSILNLPCKLPIFAIDDTFEGGHKMALRAAAELVLSLAAARDDDGEPADETWIKRIAHTRCNGVYVIDEFSCYHYFRFVFHREDRFKNADGSCDVMLCDPPGLEGPGITVFRGCTRRQVRDLCRIVGAPLKEPA